jgi:hypothetical protein
VTLTVRSLWKKGYVGVFCLVLVAACTGIAVCDLLAYRSGAPDEPQKIARAIAQHSESAGSHNSLGQYFTLSEKRADPGHGDARFAALLGSAGNMVVNGGFEEKILNMGFDWRYVEAPHVVIGVDTDQFHGGRRSLSIAFDGGAVTDAGITQLISVDENTTYNFSAYAKADDISAAHGPQFVISDADTNNQLFLSEELLGTAGWKLFSGSFRTGANTNLVSLKIIRITSEEPIKGRLWIDDVAVSR